jgi:hypothetical protein
MKKTLFSAVVTTSVVFSTLASAQDPNRADINTYKESRDKSTEQNYDVQKRSRPEYLPTGKTLGTFRLLPTVDVTTGYNDNIRTSNGSNGNKELSAMFYKIDPTLRLESQFSRHELNLFAGGGYTFFQGESDENLRTLSIGSDGRIDISGDLNLFGGIGFSQANEARAATTGNTLSTTLSAEPIEFTTFDLNAGVNKRFNRFEVSVGGFRRDINYDDSVSFAGTNLNQDDRDLEVLGLDGRASYEIAPDYKAFIKAEASKREYDIQNAFDRDSDGYRTAVGLEYAITNQITGEAFAGYMNRDFENFKDVSEPYFGGKVNWYPTPVLSVYGDADRDVQDTVFGGASSKITTDLGLGAAYEFRRNIIVSPNVGYSFGDYEGIAGTDQTYSLGSNVEYLLNRNLSFVGSYNYVNRDANGNNALNVLNYDQNVFAITAKAKL